MKLFWQIVLVFIIISVPIIFVSTKNKSQNVYTVTELSGKPNEDRIRVVGRVSTKKITYTNSPQHSLDFYITEPEGPKNFINVKYIGIKPDMFDTGKDVIIDGNYKDGTVHAITLLTQCPSKYEPPTPK